MVLDPLRVELGERSYDIQFYSGELARMAQDLAQLVPERAFLVAGAGPWKVHGEALSAALRDAGVSFDLAIVPDGERYKTLASASDLYDRLIDGRHSRRCFLIAFGGGVVGDLAGFVAATYLRGIDFAQVPTTVVAMVDSAVGGKTGLDHPKGKNLIGAFHQPKAVLVDASFLATLDDYNLRGGFAEVIKYGVIADQDFFEFLEKNIGDCLKLEPEALGHAVRVSCATKARIVGSDERESEGGQRATLNLGHTFGHAIEAVANYEETQMHGQAVAMGMCCAADMAVELGMFSAVEAGRVERLIEQAGLPTRVPSALQPEAILAAMSTDKKVRAGKTRFILPRRIGYVEMVDDIDSALVLSVLRRRLADS